MSTFVVINSETFGNGQTKCAKCTRDKKRVSLTIFGISLEPDFVVTVHPESARKSTVRAMQWYEFEVWLVRDR
jgi:hypothetical protein